MWGRPEEEPEQGESEFKTGRINNMRTWRENSIHCGGVETRCARDMLERIMQ